MAEKLTEQDIEKIKEEIEYRRVVVRQEALEAVKEARAHGDLSENFEYHAAKRDKNKNESRITYLEKILKNSTVVSTASKEGEVGLNNRVTVYMEEDDEEDTFKIVTPIRGDSNKGYISIESPIGKALLGHKEGDRVYVKVNERFGYYAVIRKIEDCNDEDEDEIRQY
ncbi:MAG: transcription elongation factor GreA [Lachnospiraceae bacterium]